MFVRKCFAPAFVFILTVYGSIAEGQEVFSLDGLSTSGFSPGDILVPGPVVAISDVSIAALGLLGGAEIDGLSDGNDSGPDLLFSVDHFSVGAAGTDVFLESTAPSGLDHPADIYRNPLSAPGTNLIFRDGNGIVASAAGPAPPLGLFEPYPLATDNVDAYDFGMIGAAGYAGPIFFTVGAAAAVGLGIDTIHVVPTPGGTTATYVGGAALFLGTSDDIDAIFVLDDLADLSFGTAADVVGYSLAPGSPALAPLSALSTAMAGGAALSPADVFIFTGSGGAFYVPAAAHGLLFTDNVTALDQVAVPEPSTFALLALAFASYFFLHRQKRN